MLQLGQVAPDFEAETTQGKIRFHEWLGDSWGVLFSHPKDYTPVCTTELGMTARLKPEFDRRGVKAIGLSVDTLDRHAGWEADIVETQGTAVNFPIISDPDKTVSNLYGMIHPEADPAVTVRTVYVIDPNKKIRLMLIYPPSAGRNFDEVLRVIDSLQTTDRHKVATPVNWKPGDKAIVLASLSDEDAKKQFPQGFTTEKPYLRWVELPPTVTKEGGVSYPTGFADGFWGAVGRTPLIRLKRASELTGCEILGKAEFMNPGGSVKDRAALGILGDAVQRGLLTPFRPGTVVEGTAGNTGIGLTLAANARGWRSVVVMPETQSREKIDFLRMIGADLRLVPAKPYADPGNYVHFSRRLAEELAQEGPTIWANQFDNLANAHAHEQTTGPEIWEQTEGRIHAFTCSCGTGGTLAGTARALKARNPEIRIVLADPLGSALYSWKKTGTVKASEGNSVTEGIGQAARVPGNLEGAPIDDAVQIPDDEALAEVFQLLAEEGLSIGGSAGINVAAAIRVARDLGPGHTVATILCDGGSRYQSKLFNPDFLREKGLPVPSWLAG